MIAMKGRIVSVGTLPFDAGIHGCALFAWGRECFTGQGIRDLPDSDKSRALQRVISPGCEGRARYGRFTR